jgi:hypothetical protein
VLRFGESKSATLPQAAWRSLCFQCGPFQLGANGTAFPAIRQSFGFARKENALIAEMAIAQLKV